MQGYLHGKILKGMTRLVMLDVPAAPYIDNYVCLIILFYY